MLRQELLTSNTNVRKELGQLLMELRAEVATDRSRQRTRLEINSRLWKGDQVSVPVLDGTALTFAPLFSPNAQAQHNRPQNKLNFYAGDGLKLIGALSTAPGYRAEIDDSDDQEAVERQRIYQELVIRLGRQWQFEYIMPQVFQTMYERGNIFLHTPYVQDTLKYGFHSQPNLIHQQQAVGFGLYRCGTCGTITPAEQIQQTNGYCPACQSILDASNFIPPEMVTVLAPDPNQPTLNYPVGSVELGIYDSRTTFTSYVLDKWENAKWLCHEVENYRGDILSRFSWIAQDPNLVRKFESGGSDDPGDPHSRIVDNATKSPSNVREERPRRRLYWRETHWWLTPAMLWWLDNPADRNALLQQFPHGAKVSVLNGLIAEVVPADLHREWVGISSSVGGGFYTKPLGDDHASVAPTLNNMTEIMVSTAEKGSPITIYDGDLLDLEALYSKPIHTLDFIKANTHISKRFADMIYQTNPAPLNNNVPMAFELFRDGARDVANILPPMYGAAPPEQTLGATSLKRDQAMAPHNIPYSNFRKGAGRAFDNGVYQLVKNALPDGTVYFSPRPGEREVFQHPSIHTALGGGVYTRIDDNIPLNWAQKSAKTWQALELPPDVSQGLLGLSNPINVRQVQDALGMKEIKLPLLDAYNKVMRTISQLSKAAPIMPPPPDPLMLQEMQMQGIPMPPMEPQPSIPIDEFEDDHEFCVAVVKAWAQTDKADQLRKSFPDGYANVIAWGKAHLTVVNMLMQQQQMMQMQMQMQAGPGPGNESSGSGGGPEGGGGGGGNEGQPPPAPEQQDPPPSELRNPVG